MRAAPKCRSDLTGHVMRLLALALSLVFLRGAGTDVYGLHGCPHHGAPGGGGAPPSARHHSAHASAPPTSEEPDEPGAPCACVGACHVGAATPVGSPGGTELARPVRPRGVVGPRWDATSGASRLLPYLHPYANPPPIGTGA